MKLREQRLQSLNCTSPFYSLRKGHNSVYIIWGWEVICHDGFFCMIFLK